MFLVFGFLAFFGMGYLCLKGVQAIGKKRSMANPEWLRKKLVTDKRFSQAEKLSVLDESAIAFHSDVRKIYLASKKVDWRQGSNHQRKHNGWAFTVKEYNFADFIDAEEVDTDFQERHISLCPKVPGQQVWVSWGHIDVVNALKPYLTGKQAVGGEGQPVT